ncbi:MAG: ABC-F family ATP-binding cassette domain-containing protein [Bacteroidales bacterium]|jgi:ATP-binding cassette subfamily F protein 3|nr:ABC-F family ATP-binding cassette domain-containing protein [Bacteroidales bacterium]
MVSLEKVSLNFGGFDLLKEVSLLINHKDRIGLIGKNGAGKTTMLKMIAGLSQYSSGIISLPKDITIGYLPQQMFHFDSRSVKEETSLAFGELLKIKELISQLNHDVVFSKCYESAEYLNKLDKLSELNERYSILGGDNYEAELEQTLIGLGFERSDFHRSTAEFSGGWRMRIELAKLLLKKPDIFLLDEPTNHLDIESIQWLEDFLRNYKGAILLVSHDKAFLDAICERTIEISLGKITDQKMNYSNFIKWRKEQKDIQISAYRNQQKLIDNTEKFIERFRYKATKAVQVQSRIKQLERLDRNRIEIEEEDNSSLKINFPPAPRSGREVVKCVGVTKKYDSHTVLENINLTIENGDKVAFVGRNGEGKTTLARIIMQELEHEGIVQLGHNVKIGYFAQNQAQLLNEELTVFETVDEIAVGEVRTKIRDILGAFLFPGEDVDKKVKVLSGGEKSRLAMIRLMLEPVNFLILDEPTNHLDMRSKDILKNALINFAGTVLVVSHDRDFLDGMATCIYEFRNKKTKQHLGGIYDFLQKNKIESLKELNVKSISQGSNIRQQCIPENRISFEEKKKISRNIANMEKQVENTELEIAKLEEEITVLNKLLSAPENIDNHNFFNKYEKLKIEMENAMETWEKEHNDLEELKLKKTW